MIQSRAKSYLLLHLLLLVYSFASVFSKMAGGKPFLSGPFLLLYGASLLMLIVYALLWQQVLKELPLSVAFANKGAVLLWGMVLGWLFFDESISLVKLLALAIVFVGIFLVVTADE